MKVLFDIPKQAISIEGDGSDLIKLLEIVREVAPNMPQITINTLGDATQEKTGGKGATVSVNGTQTLRQFVRKIPLTSNSEKIAAIAYFKSETEQLELFTPKLMGEWFTTCGFLKPNQMPVAIHDARKRHGYVKSASHGNWQLTTNGLNLIIGKLNENEEEE